MKKLSKTEEGELKKFAMENRLLSCHIVDEAERLKVWHILKDKGLIRFKGNQDGLQFFELVK